MKSMLTLIATAIFITHVHAEDGSIPYGTTKIMPGSSEMTHGEIRKIDTANGMVVIKHGPLKNLGMPGNGHGIQCRKPGHAEESRDRKQGRFRR